MTTLNIQHLESLIDISASSEKVWNAVQNVDVVDSPRNFFFSLLDIPKPLKAILEGSGIGARRVAVFSNGKKFIQTVTEWNELVSYSFRFEAEPGFRVGYFFDLSKETFRILSGGYELVLLPEGVRLHLKSQFTVKIAALRPIIGRLLKAYQMDLLKRIKVSCETTPNAHA